MQNKDQEEEEITRCSQVKNCTLLTTRRINVKSELNMYLNLHQIFGLNGPFNQSQMDLKLSFHHLKGSSVSGEASMLPPCR